MTTAHKHIRLAALVSLSFAAPLTPVLTAQSAAGTQGAAASSQATTPGIPYTAAKLAALLPATVYFQGQSAPLQIRNAGGVTFANGEPAWVSLVDSSGYSSAIQEKYQFYLVTEGPLRIGDTTVAAGAYGGGFLGDHFLLMDLGGHTIAQGPVTTDAALARPRPLELRPSSASAAKLYLGRKWVLLQTATP